MYKPNFVQLLQAIEGSEDGEDGEEVSSLSSRRRRHKSSVMCSHVQLWSHVLDSSLETAPEFGLGTVSNLKAVVLTFYSAAGLWGMQFPAEQRDTQQQLPRQTRVACKVLSPNPKPQN